MEEDLFWNNGKAVDVITDNKVLADILGGRAKADPRYTEYTDAILDQVSRLFIDRGWGPRYKNGDPIRWRERGMNKEADYLANWALDNRKKISYTNTKEIEDKENLHLMGWSDGGSRDSENGSSSAWILKVCGADGTWTIIAASATYYDRVAESSLEVECKAMLELWNAIHRFEYDPKGKVAIETNDTCEPNSVKRRRWGALSLMNIVQHNSG